MKSCTDSTLILICSVLDLFEKEKLTCTFSIPSTCQLYEKLREKMCLIADINELKVFVDLASISAGENDMDVDRVACFHDAVLGYSSMLYELKPDSGFCVFQEVVKKLWRALENDENLPKKLVRSCL